MPRRPRRVLSRLRCGAARTTSGRCSVTGSPTSGPRATRSGSACSAAPRTSATTSRPVTGRSSPPTGTSRTTRSGRPRWTASSPSWPGGTTWARAGPSWTGSTCCSPPVSGPELTASVPAGIGEVTVTLLGRFAVTVGGVPVPETRWQRRQAAALVKVLALAPGRRLHREQVMDLLWPQDTIAEAAPKLHKAAHYARRALGVPGAVVLRGESILLCPRASVTVDAACFEDLARRALGTGDAAAAREALARYGGELLPADRYEEWAEAHREHRPAPAAGRRGPGRRAVPAARGPDRVGRRGLPGRAGAGGRGPAARGRAGAGHGAGAAGRPADRARRPGRDARLPGRAGRRRRAGRARRRAGRGRRRAGRARRRVGRGPAAARPARAQRYRVGRPGHGGGGTGRPGRRRGRRHRAGPGQVRVLHGRLRHRAGRGGAGGAADPGGHAQLAGARPGRAAGPARAPDGRLVRPDPDRAAPAPRRPGRGRRDLRRLPVLGRVRAVRPGALPRDPRTGS